MKSSTTKIVCDGCGKVFYLPDPPEKPTDGVEEIKEVMDAFGRILSFCNWRCLLKYGVEYLKATPNESRAYKAVEELENLPQTADNFSLRD